MGGARHRRGDWVGEPNAATWALIDVKVFHTLAPDGWRIGVVQICFLTRIFQPSADGSFRHRVLDAAAGMAISMVWEQPARNFLGKALRSIVGIADGHLQDGLLKSLKFLFRMCLDQKRHPSRKAQLRQAWYIRHLITFFLYQMMRASKVSVHL